jgi:hypothetical protein
MPYMSSAQLAKYNDFSYAVRHNPSFYAWHCLRITLDR